MDKLTLNVDAQVKFIELGYYLNKVIEAGELHNLTCRQCQQEPFGFDDFHKNWKAIGKCTVCERPNEMVSNPHIIQFFISHGTDFSKVTKSNFPLFLQYKLLLHRLIKDSKGNYNGFKSAENPLIINV